MSLEWLKPSSLHHVGLGSNPPTIVFTLLGWNSKALSGASPGSCPQLSSLMSLES